MKKLIMHYDMDAFYASVEIRDNPKLQGKPVIVGTRVVTTCNYEARKYGLHSAMSVKEAKKLCPKGIYLDCDKEKYYEISKTIQSLILKLSHDVEFIALDEGYIDISLLYEKYKETHDDTYLITGDIKDRTDILAEFKQKDNAVLFATSSIMSTGISVNNLHNLFFASSQKAKVATIQSIGRLMRLHESKNIAHVFDIVDIIGKNNITQKHVDERIKHYNEEQIKYEISFIDID